LAGRQRQYQVRHLLNQLAVQNERLRQAVRNREESEERLYTLYQLSELATHAATLEQLFEATLRALKHLLGVERASILLVDDRGVMQFRAWYNLSATYRQQVEGHSPWAAGEREPQPVLIPDVAEADLGRLEATIQDEGIGALAFIPLVEEGQLFGKLALYYNQPHSFLDTEVQLAQTIARHVAHAIQRKQAEAVLQQLNTQLEQRVEERTAELARSNRELDQFAYVASHDLKAPLRAIKHLASWLSEDLGATLPPQSQQHLMKLQSRIGRMEKLLDDLLAYSRVDRRRHHLERVDTETLVRNVVELLTVPPGFRVTLVEEMPVVTTERVPLETVLRNLIGNSFKHHPDPRTGEVTIAAQARNGMVEFTVADNGNGIAPGFHGRIFELFQTLQPRDEVEGSGIGLAVVKKLVENQGGKVQVTSTPGKGATFTFTWPAT
jgi:signal transduction histidine kinase